MNEFQIFLAQISEQMQNKWTYHVALRKIGKSVIYEKNLEPDQVKMLREMIDFYSMVKLNVPRDELLPGYFSSLSVIKDDRLKELRRHRVQCI